MEQTAKIYIAGHRGMVGSAIERKLKEEGYNNIVKRTSAELDLRNQQAVNNALQSPMPMQALAPLLMNVQPVELANAIRVKIGQMKQGLA